MAIEVVATKASLTFFDPAAIRELGVNVWIDENEWLVGKFTLYTYHELRFFQSDYKIGDPILHIELRRWADVVLVAPCSANTLAKIAGGLCDNLAVCTVADFMFPCVNEECRSRHHFYELFLRTHLHSYTLR